MTVEEMCSYTLRPGQCLVEPVRNPAQTDSGILFAERYSPWQPKGHVMVMGDARLTAMGVPIDPEFEPGDCVLLMPVQGVRFDLADKRRLVLMDVDDIMAVFEA